MEFTSLAAGEGNSHTAVSISKLLQQSCASTPLPKHTPTNNEPTLKFESQNEVENRIHQGNPLSNWLRKIWTYFLFSAFVKVKDTAVYVFEIVSFFFSIV